MQESDRCGRDERCKDERNKRGLEVREMKERVRDEEDEREVKGGID